MECSTNSLIKAVKNSHGISIGENSHMLLHLNLVEDGEYNNITLASAYVTRKVFYFSKPDWPSAAWTDLCSTIFTTV